MKQRIAALMMALILCVSLVPSGFAATPKLEDCINMDQLVKHGTQMISALETGGNYSCVNNMKLAANHYVVGMGIFGWIGSSALQLFKWICADSPEFSRQTLGNALYNEVVNAPVVDPAMKTPDWNYWLHRSFSQTELNAAKKLLGSDAGIRMQNHLAELYLRAQAQRGWDAGVRTEAALLYYCSADNHYGMNGVKNFMAGVRAALGLKSTDLITSLNQFQSGMLAAAKAGNETVYRTAAYRTKVYNYIIGTLKLSGDGATTPFTDMPEADNWAYDAVVWAYQAEPRILRGTSPTTMDPNQTVTRSEAVTFLWRAAGEPEPTIKTSPFVDVEEGSYYYKPVLWALEKGVTNGTSATTFSPEEKVKREQMVTFLWRFIDTPDSTKKEVPFTDVDSEQYYYQAVVWAYHDGIFVGNEGDGKRTLSVAEGCSRAYVVTYLYNCFLQPDFSQHR